MNILRSHRSRIRSGRHGRRGATMVEFGLTFTIFMMLVVTSIEGGRLVWSWVTLSHATRQGARYAMVHGKYNPVTDLVIETRVKNQALGLQGSRINVSTTWADPAKERGTLVQIDSSYQFQSVISPLLNGAGTVLLRSRTGVTVAN